MTVTIATWNSRGNPANDEGKKQVLADLFRRAHIVLIQECGQLVWPGAWVYRSIHAGAFNERCNSCIISKVELKAPSLGTLPSSNGRAFSHGTVKDAEGSFVVATLHANASYDAALDGRTALQELSSVYKDAPIVVGGDFNVEPIYLSAEGTRSVHVGSSTRGCDFHVACTSGPAHTSGHLLDYFVLNPLLASENTQPYHLWGGSDHRPVLTTVKRRSA